MEQLGNGFRLKVILASLASLGLVSYVDYITGYELLFFIFYFVPVGLCAWYLGRFAVLCLAVTSGIAWFSVDLLSEHHYPHEAFRYWNGFICFLAFAIVGLVLQQLRRSLDEQTRARREIAKTLDDLNRSADEIRKLQGQLQVVCAWTKRIRIEGKWVALDEFLANQLHIPVSHGISPEAMREAMDKLKK